MKNPFKKDDEQPKNPKKKKSNNNRKNSNDKKKSHLIDIWLLGIMTLYIILFFIYNMSTNNTNTEEIAKKNTVTYTEFLKMVDEGKVDTVYYNPTNENMSFTVFTEESKKLKEEEGDTSSYTYTAEDTYHTLYPGGEGFREKLLRKNVNLKINRTADNLARVISTIISIGFPVAMLILLFKMMGNVGNGIIGGKNAPFKIEHSDKKFDDVIGQDEILDDIKFITRLIKEPELGVELNAKVPKGLLLVGEPGTGKTLTAKAIAGEADVPFIYANASGFIEMFVGVGAKRVRDLFKLAKENKPCIVFIDEIDAIGAKRNSRTSHSENDQTINQLLQEMDGFAEREGIFVIAATNRLDTLDKALIRSGRFDRHITVPKPRNWNVRLELFEHYFKETKLAEDVDLEYFSKQTQNFTGADIEAICNEATLIAVMDDKKFVDRESIEKAIDKKIFKGNRSKAKQHEEDINIVAYHEAGHAVMTYLCDMPISRASIISSTSGVGGFVMQEESDSLFTTKRDFEHRLCICYAGRASEKIKFGDITTGASNDITQATGILQDYLTKYGFDTDDTGIIDIDVIENAELTNEYIFNRVRALSKTYMNLAYNNLKEHYNLVEVLAQELLEKETLNGDEITALFKKEEDREEHKEEDKKDESE